MKLFVPKSKHEGMKRSHKNNGRKEGFFSMLIFNLEGNLIKRKFFFQARLLTNINA